MIKSKHWSDMRAAGVKLGVALPLGHVLLRPLHGRIDLRNHRKNVVIDDRITLIGSANMDRRSFDLNYENNILFWDEALTARMLERQQAYLASSNVVAREQVEAWSAGRRLWNNAIGMLGPVL